MINIIVGGNNTICASFDLSTVLLDGIDGQSKEGTKNSFSAGFDTGEGINYSENCSDVCVCMCMYVCVCMYVCIYVCMCLYESINLSIMVSYQFSNSTSILRIVPRAFTPLSFFPVPAPVPLTYGINRVKKTTISHAQKHGNGINSIEVKERSSVYIKKRIIDRYDSLHLFRNYFFANVFFGIK